MSPLNRWKILVRAQPQASERILDLVLPACEVLRGHSPHAQVAIIRSDAGCKELRDLLRQHHTALSLPDDDLAYVAFVLKLCYCVIVRAEGTRT